MWGSRVPHSAVHTVEDAAQVSAPVRQEALEPVTAGHLDLAGIGGTHGADAVRQPETGLEEADVPVEFDALGGEGVAGQPKVIQQGGREAPLKGDVVDGHHRCGPGSTPIRDIGGHQARRRPGQGREALGQVLGLAVGAARALEKGWLVQQVERQARRLGAQDPGGAPAHEVRQRRDLALQGHRVADRGVCGQEQTDIGAKDTHGPGQGGHHIAQAAGLDVGEQLRGNKQGFQKASAPADPACAGRSA